MEHDLIKTGDPDAFFAILDRNNEVALSYCRRCQRGEGELAVTCPGARCFCNRSGDFVCTACLEIREDPHAEFLASENDRERGRQ